MYDRLTDSVTRRAFDLVLANWLLDETVMRLGCVYIYIMALNLTRFGISLFLNPNF